jgi:hypothetical protein
VAALLLLASAEQTQRMRPRTRTEDAAR